MAVPPAASPLHGFCTEIARKLHGSGRGSQAATTGIHTEPDGSINGVIVRLHELDSDTAGRLRT